MFPKERLALTLERQGMRNEMIVSSFIYVSFGQVINARCPNDVPVLRFGEHHRIHAVVQEGHL